MKKKITLMICLFLMMLGLFSVHSFARNQQKLVDKVGLLSEDEAETLQTTLTEIAEKYQMDMVILITPSCDGNPQWYTENYYETNGYGYGPYDDGVIFMLAMQERKFHIAPFEGAMRVFTDYGMDRIDQLITPDLKDGDYYEALVTYTDLCEKFFAEEEAGRPFDYDHPYKKHMSFALQLLIALGIGLVITGIVLFILYAQLKSVSWNKQAHEYVKDGSFQVTNSKDLFLYKSVVKHKIEKSSSGGTSSHSTGGGHSAGGHTGSF